MTEWQPIETAPSPVMVCQPQGTDGKTRYERRIVELEALLRRMLASNEMSNGWKAEILTALGKDQE